MKLSSPLGGRYHSDQFHKIPGFRVSVISRKHSEQVRGMGDQNLFVQSEIRNIRFASSRAQSVHTGFARPLFIASRGYRYFYFETSHPSYSTIKDDHFVAA